MVIFNIDENNARFTFKLVNEEIHFSFLISLFKQNKLMMDFTSKIWYTTSNLICLDLLPELKSYTEVVYTEDDIEFLKSLTYPKDFTFKKVKRCIDKDLITEFPPLTGKPGFENFQLQAISKCITQNRVILDIEMRHGKSFISLISFGTLYKKGVVDRLLVICKPEGMYNYYLEALKFLHSIFNEDDIALCTTQNRQIEDLFDKKIIITNYTTFKLSCKYYQKQKAKGSALKAKCPKKTYIDFESWGSNRMIILDECQALNNPTSQQSKTLVTYSKHFEHRIAMSGSLKYKFIQLYQLCKFLVPQTINMSYSAWKDYTCDTFRFYVTPKPTKVKEYQEKVVDKLQVVFHNCIQSSDFVEQDTYIQMSNKMRKMYQDFISNTLNERRGKIEGELTKAEIKTLFIYLYQFLSDPSLLEMPKWKFADNPKIEVLKSILDKEIGDLGKRVVIWSGHPRVLDELKEILAKYNPITIHGNQKTSCKKIDRDKYLDKFRKNKDNKILLSSYVNATSISLVEATVNIYFDLPLDNDLYEQSKRRIHGPKQKNDVITYMLMFDKSMDVYVKEEILGKKKKVKDCLSSTKPLTLEDYKDVFNASKTNFLSYN